MDALYFRVSSDRQTTENQFAEVLEYAYSRSDTNSAMLKGELIELKACIREIPAPTAANPARTVFKAVDSAVESLAKRCIYIEQGKSSKTGSQRPLFERMKKDAAAGRFSRLLVWKVSRLGRDMREVLNAVYELADLGITVVPVKSNTGPITSAMGKLLWAILAWFAEMENVERADAINAGLERARKAGKTLGRPKKVFDREKARELRSAGKSNREIAYRMGVSEATVRRELKCQ